MTIPLLPVPAGTRVLATAGDPQTATRLAVAVEAGAHVRVVTPHVCAIILDWHERGLVTWEQRRPTADDLLGADLVINAPASDQPEPAPATPEPEHGRVTLVGGGPSDPGLLTVAGREALHAADVIVTDRLAPVAALAELSAQVEIVDVGKIPHGRSTPQETINEILIDRARAGRRVVRLKGGDSYVFGRGGEEVEACVAAGVPVDVIPGVTSAISAPELAGIPVTHRGLTQGFTVVSGHVPPGHPDSTVDWAALARTGTTIVVLMGVRTLPAITAALIEAGLDADTPAAVVADASQASQQVARGTVATIAEAAQAAQIGAPAVTVIGRVAALGATGAS